MTEQKKKYNPSLGGAFSNDKFGEGSVILNITEENYDVVMKNLQVGSSILFRFNKVTAKGNKHYFTEILPPMNATTAKAKTTKAAATTELD